MRTYYIIKHISKDKKKVYYNAHKRGLLSMLNIYNKHNEFPYHPPFLMYSVISYEEMVENVLASSANECEKKLQTILKRRSDTKVKEHIQIARVLKI